MINEVKLYFLLILLSALCGAFLALHFHEDKACPVAQEVQVDTVVKKKAYRLPNGTAVVETVVEKSSHTSIKPPEKNNYLLGAARSIDGYSVTAGKRLFGDFYGIIRIENNLNLNRVELGLMGTF